MFLEVLNNNLSGVSFFSNDHKTLHRLQLLLSVSACFLFGEWTGCRVNLQYHLMLIIPIPLHLCMPISLPGISTLIFIWGSLWIQFLHESFSHTLAHKPLTCFSFLVSLIIPDVPFNARSYSMLCFITYGCPFSPISQFSEAEISLP